MNEETVESAAVLPAKPWVGADCLLLYAGLGGGAGLDAPKTTQMIYDSQNFNGLKTHLLGSIWGNGVMPWKLKPNGRFDLTVDNEEYYTAFDVLCGNLGRRRLHLDICFGDVGFLGKDAAAQGNPHPFRNNVNNFSWADDARKFYNAYDYSAKEQTWISTSPVNKKVTVAGITYDLSLVRENDPSTYVVLMPDVARFFDRIIAILDKHGRVRGYWRSFSEQAGAVGGNSMIDMWIRRKMILAGIAKRIHWKEDYASVGPYDPTAYKASYNYVLNHGGIKEFHSPMKPQTPGDPHSPFRYLKLFELVDERGEWLSDDGDQDGDIAGQKNLRRLAKLGFIAGTDLKTGVKPGNHWQQFNVQANIDDNFVWQDGQL
jgi:hypothetical protein